MDGVHDLGGRQGFGPVGFTPDAAARHAAWEARANVLYGMAVRLGIINMDEYRHAIERMDPRHYLGASYYERSLTGVATLLVEKGVVTRAELEALAGGGFPLSHPGTGGRSNASDRRRFQRGERVRVKDDFVPGHVRMPGYIRGKTGVIVGEGPPTPFPDAHAHGLHAEDEPTYDVRFRSEDLWPKGAEASLVHACVFQSYLEQAG
ncbi:SH3-like domain-containing protein [Falsiroseomonas sp. HW251]|uniref:SH3-like domain-containing protein n=1 Tax=Falsiroseomonas sp. HW251 TaxID=3390998 RepID=UPI003D313F34